MNDTNSASSPLILLTGGVGAYLWFVGGPSMSANYIALMVMGICFVLLMVWAIGSAFEDHSGLWSSLGFIMVGAFLWLANKSGVPSGELWGLYMAELGYLLLTVFLPKAKVASPITTRNRLQADRPNPAQSVNNPLIADAQYKAEDNQPDSTKRQAATKPGIKFTFPAEQPKVTFDAIVGMDAIKKKLIRVGSEIVGVPDPKKHQTYVSPRNGILLYGKPGNGKTLFAEALAGELHLPIITLTCGDTASMWVNQTTEQVVTAFKDAKAQAPCVLFIDEIDSFLVQRAKISQADSEVGRTVNTILTEIVDLREGIGIVLVAATNYLNRLDEAAIREGRFDFKVEITPPDQPARQAILLSGLRNCGKTSVDMNGVNLAIQRWEGFSAARIRAIGSEVKDILVATPNKKNAVDFQMLRKALRNVQGRHGQPIGADVPTLDKLVMSIEMHERLHGIAHRMENVVEVEELGGSVPAGLLLYGPPGTGKTFTVRSLAKTTGWAFLATSGQDLMAKPERIDEILESAADIRPCIVFIDEADDVLGDRRASPWSAAVTNKLLGAIDGSGGKILDVLFVAATNHPETLDSAAIQGGRFTEKIEFSLPDRKAILDFLEDWLSKAKSPIGADISKESLASLMQGYSIANLKEILQHAVNHMIGRKKKDGDATLKYEDFLAAIEVLGIAPETAG